MMRPFLGYVLFFACALPLWLVACPTPPVNEPQVEKAQDATTEVAKEQATETAVETQTEATPDPTPEAKPEPKPEPKAEIKPEVPPEPKPEITPEPPPDRDFSRKSGSTAIAADQKWFASANRDSGSVTIFLLGTDLDLVNGSKFSVKLGNQDVEVSSISAGHDDTYILATLQYGQKVCKIVIADGAGQTPKCATTGSEPVGVVTNEGGTRVYVSNMVDGSITVFDGSLTKLHTLDFSDTNGEAKVRPFALLYVRNKGARGNLYVTNFFSEKIPGKQEGNDDSRQGAVYKIPGDASTLANQVKIDLPPLTDAGFRVPDDQLHCATDKTKAGCTGDAIPSGAFPNQLASLTLHQGRIFVASTCASPRGEVRFNVNVQSCVHAIDAATDKEIPALRLNVQERIRQQPDPRRFCTVPNDLFCVPETAFCYIVCSASDLVIRLDYKTFTDTASVVAGVTGTNNLPTGKFPTGAVVAISPTKTVSFVYNENSRNITILNLRDQKPEGSVLSADLPTDPKEIEILKGKDFFFTSRGRWSNESWSGCFACHWRGLTDNVTWHFAAGPRQSTSLDSSYSKEKVTPDSLGNRHGFSAVVAALKAKTLFPQRIFNWTAIFDEVSDFENNTRGVSGGLGAIVDKDNKPVNLGDFPAGNNNNNNNGSSFAVVQDLLNNGGIDDWVAITEYVKTIRSPRAKTNLAGDPAAGKQLFETTYNCNVCHAGGNWTLSRVYFQPTLNGSVSGALKKKFLTDFAAGKNAKLTTLLPLFDPNSTCTTDADCKAVVGACDTTAKKCRTLALGNEFFFSLNRAPDIHTCATRNVGTFESATAAKGALEVRKDMAAAAQGSAGFNIPSLLGVNFGAPYLHNGQYETLADFLKGDDKHRTLINKVAGMNDQQAKDLIAYLLTIDGATAPFAINADDDICPPSFP